MFYKSFIESLLRYCIICWYGHYKITHKNKLGRTVKTCVKSWGSSRLNEVYRLYLTEKANMVCMDTSHPHAVEFQPLPSHLRYMYSKIRASRAKLIYSHGNNFIKQDAVQWGVWGNTWIRGGGVAVTDDHGPLLFLFI